MSCSVHDSVELEAAGVPAVAVHTEAFMNSAAAHAIAYGRPDYTSAAVRHPIADVRGAEIDARAEEVVGTIVALVTGAAPEEDA